MKNKSILKCFTLVELLIVLTIMGTILAFIVPIGIGAAPNKEVVKFKNMDRTLFNVINELVSSDKYYFNGDLGKKSDETLIDKTHDEDYTYFCKSIADTLNTKEVNCTKQDTGGKKFYTANGLYYNAETQRETEEGKSIEELLDLGCLSEIITNNKKRNEIVLSNDVTIYTGNPISTFGEKDIRGERIYLKTWDNIGKGCQPTYYSYDSKNCSYGYLDLNDGISGAGHPGYLFIYKLICIDIDGIPESTTLNNCVNECPFGYGVRVDGKIIRGKRAKEWFKKKLRDK